VSFESFIEGLLDACPGAQGAAIVDADGIPVIAKPTGIELEVLGAEFAAILRDVGQGGSDLKHGHLQQVSVCAQDAVVILTTIVAGYFLVLLLGPEAQVGRGRFYSRVAGVRLLSEFV